MRMRPASRPKSPADTRPRPKRSSGTDLGLNPGNSDVAIVAEFADASAWRAYLEAPAHVSFVEDHVTPLCASWGAIQLDTIQAL